MKVLLVGCVAVGLMALGSWVLVGASGAALDGVLCWVVHGVTQTGSARIAPVVLLLALVVWTTDPRIPWAERRRDGLVLFLSMSILLPVVGTLNEHVVKPHMARPRPSHLRLVEAGIIPDLDAFDRLDADTRRSFLEARLAQDDTKEAVESLGLHPVVLGHWIQEMGYTFPSGHALNAFFAAALFLGGAFANPTPHRRALALGLLLWALAVGWSRTLLQVHTVLDVTAGGLAGTILGATTSLLLWRSTRRANR